MLISDMVLPCPGLYILNRDAKFCVALPKAVIASAYLWDREVLRLVVKYHRQQKPTL
jgi:hypothetical protein